jgi:hypothetical protein
MNTTILFAIVPNFNGLINFLNGINIPHPE